MAEATLGMSLSNVTEVFSNVTTTEAPEDPDVFYYQLAEDVFNWIDPFLTIGKYLTPTTFVSVIIPYMSLASWSR